MNRVLNVANVQLTTWKQSFGWPIAILGISFGFNLAFFASLGGRVSEPITYGLVSIFIFQAIMCANLMTQGFSFAVGLNVTRRTFFAASTVVVVLQSVTFSVMLYLLAVIERLTDGWGIRLAYFTVLPITKTYSPLSIAVFLVPMLVSSFVGLFLGIVGKRWGTNGVLGLMTAFVVALGVLSVTISWLDGWSSIGTWLANEPGLALTAGWTLLPLALLAAGSYGLTRRAVP